ncbi:MAG: HAMP domain-containing histidine kinase, partial [Planctomycetes bacterium]|nr:HAMP domain-containing histidine kinase [Planctomycetota bacterium]
GFAHEVRNPLSTIGLHLGLIREDFAAAESTRDRRTLRRIEVLQSEVRRVQSILDGFLQYVRLPVLHRRPVELNSLLASLVEFLAPEAAAKGVSLRFYPHPEVGLFDLDPDLFRAMIVNLLRNAVQACSEGDEILLSTLRQGGEVMVRVTDTGPGMDAETRERAFTPYFSTKKDGTGLGLPIVRRVAEQHGGSIHMSSEPGKGTQFSLLFPSQRLLDAGDGAGGAAGSEDGDG